MKNPEVDTRTTKLSRFNSHRGFSLVETIVAFVILSIILLAVGFLPIITTRLMSDTVEREKAVLLAVGKLDAIEADPTLTSPDNSKVPYSMSWQINGSLVELKVSWPGVTGVKEMIFRRVLFLN